MQHENEMTQQESLQIIQQMIQSAKQEQKDDGKGWIIWGWMLFIASVATIPNLVYKWLPTFFFWNAFGAASIVLGIFAAGKVIFFRKNKPVKTYTHDIFRKLNAGFFVSLMFIIIATNIGISPIIGFPLMMSLYGFWILIYGSMLNFKPSIIGAYIMWALAFIALFIPRIVDSPVDDQTKLFMWVMALHALGILCGYIIPGHIAKSEFKKVSARQSTNQ
jgi:MFS family permease